MNTKILVASTMLAMVASGSVSAKDDVFSIKEQFGGAQISFTSNGSGSNSTLTLSGPDGFAVSKVEQSGIPSINLSQYNDLKDGLYHYEITTNTGPLVLIQDKINNGRGENNSHYARKGVTKSGTFRVVNGQIKTFQNIKEPKFR